MSSCIRAMFLYLQHSLEYGEYGVASAGKVLVGAGWSSREWHANLFAMRLETNQALSHEAQL